MDAALQRIEALPGSGRYAVTFVRADGTEQGAVIQLGATGIDVAESSLPPGWARGSAAMRALVATLTAFEKARQHMPSRAVLQDVEGGWDVSLGNVVLDAAGVPACTAHGRLEKSAGHYVCAECGAAARLAAPS